MDENDEHREYEEGFGQHDHYVELIKLYNVMIITTHVIIHGIIYYCQIGTLGRPVVKLEMDLIKHKNKILKINIVR